jgi:hypothetical protein
MKAQKLSHITFYKMKFFSKQTAKFESSSNLKNITLSYNELLCVRGGTDGDNGGIIKGSK